MYLELTNIPESGDAYYEHTIARGIEKILGFEREYEGSYTPADTIIHGLRGKDSLYIDEKLLRSIVFEVHAPEPKDYRKATVGTYTKKRLTKRQAYLVMVLLYTRKVYKTIPTVIKDELDLGNTIRLWDVIILMGN